jgi:hypothetical protein
MTASAFVATAEIAPDRAAFAEPFRVKRRAVVVAGMHRSGTSALTRVLGYCGLRMPRTLVPANEGNRAGHWESELVCRFNDALLARFGLDWISWERATPDLASERDYGDLLREGRRIILHEFGANGDIVLKDPRICRLLPFWLGVLAGLDIEPAIVLAVRAPQQVARSLERRNAIMPAYGLRAWLRFTLEAERASRHLPRVVVSFDQLMRDWRAAATALNRCAGSDLLAFTPDAERAVCAFLSKDLRHFTRDDEGSTPACVARVYRLFSEWQERPESCEDHAELDAIRSRLDEAPPCSSGAASQVGARNGFDGSASGSRVPSPGRRIALRSPSSRRDLSRLPERRCAAAAFTANSPAAGDRP